MYGLSSYLSPMVSSTTNYTQSRVGSLLQLQRSHRCRQAYNLWVQFTRERHTLEMKLGQRTPKIENLKRIMIESEENWNAVDGFVPKIKERTKAEEVRDQESILFLKDDPSQQSEPRERRRKSFFLVGRHE